MKAFIDKFYSLPRWISWRLIFISLIIAAVLAWLAVFEIPERQLEISFIDVGNGDAILIQTPSRQQVLVDGGPDPEDVCIALGDELPFWDKSLDLVVLTHPDEDHIVGLIEVLDRYKVEKVLEPGLEVDTPVYREWLRLIDDKNIQRIIAQAGQKIELGNGVKINVLHPQESLESGTGSDTNNNSVVLRLVCNEISFLLTGDIQQETEQDIIYRGDCMNSTVLKVAHHGSDTSSCSQFLAAVDPQVAVISVGKENFFGHPDVDVLARLRNEVDEDRIYLTSEDGTIKFTTDGKRLWVETKK